MSMAIPFIKQMWTCVCVGSVGQCIPVWQYPEIDFTKQCWTIWFQRMWNQTDQAWSYFFSKTRISPLIIEEHNKKIWVINSAEN